MRGAGGIFFLGKFLSLSLAPDDILNEFGLVVNDLVSEENYINGLKMGFFDFK